MTLQQKKEKLFNEIMDEANERCYDCFECDENHVCLNLRCDLHDKVQTAILSLDKKENWPEIFKGE